MSKAAEVLVDSHAFVRCRSFLDGWDAHERCLLDTLSWVPDDQLVHVVRTLQRRRGIEVRA